MDYIDVLQDGFTTDDEERIDPAAATTDFLFPDQASAMPKIITDNLSGIPCIATQASAHHYRLVGLEISADVAVINSYGLVNLGTSAASQNSLNKVPHHFVIDRCYIDGHTQAEIMKYGVRLDRANAAIIDSYISDFHSVGFDAQAISGINGPGPFKIINNYLEASGENILFGGAAPVITGLVPSDIEIRQNYFYNRLVSSSIDGDNEWGEWDWRGHHVDGSPFLMRGVTILIIRDGLIAEGRLYVDPVEDAGEDIDTAVRELYKPPSADE